MFSSALNGVLGALARDIAIDLGTSATRIAVHGKGVVTDEPSVVALRAAGGGRDPAAPRRILAVGSDALAMLGRCPEDVEVVRPIRDGVISDFQVTEMMLRELILRSTAGQILGPRALVCIPHGTTEVEKRALRECAEAAGAREVTLFDQPLAAALGAGLDIAEARGCMVVDIGGGTTEVAVIALGGIVHSRSVRVGGDAMDEAIIRYVRSTHDLLLGPVSAEQAKLELTDLRPRKEKAKLKKMELRGRDLRTGFPRALEMDAGQVRSALEAPVRLILETVVGALHRTPPELSSDIAETGVVLTGNGALLRGLDVALREVCGVPVILAEDPGTAVVRGAARVLARGR